MEMCAACGMTGWQERPGSRVLPWYAWTNSEMTPVKDITVDLLDRIRLRAPGQADAPPAFPRLPRDTPPLPLWTCSCEVSPGQKRWHSQRSVVCSECKQRFPWRLAKMRWAKDGAGVQHAAPPRSAPVLPNDYKMPLIRQIFQDVLWSAGGGAGGKSNPWRACAMGPAYKVGHGNRSEYIVVLQGLGSCTHPMHAHHPHAPLLLRITPAGAEIVCSAHECTWKGTGLRAVAQESLFSASPGAQLSISRQQWDSKEQRLNWMRCVVEGHRQRCLVQGT